MKKLKLKLELDELAVESFAALSEAGARGTVQARDDVAAFSEPSICRTCDGDRTCFTINCC